MRWPRPKTVVALAAILFLVAIVIVWRTVTPSLDIRQMHAQARRAFHRGDHATVLATCQQLAPTHAASSQLLIMAGESASRLEQYELAIELYDRVPDAAEDDAATARWAAGEVALQLKQMTRAIDKLRQAIALDANKDQARERLIYLLNLSGQRWEAAPHLLEMIRHGQGSAQHLLYLGNLAKSIENETEINQFLRATPSDALPLLGLARIRFRAGALEETERLLEQVLKQAPKLVEAHAQLGRLWLQLAPQRLADWNRLLPDNADQHPDIWLVRGQWARQAELPAAAARCFAEAIRLDPDHVPALQALVQVLGGSGPAAVVTTLQQRAAAVEELLFVLERIMADEWSGRQALSAQQISEADYLIYLRSATRLEPIFKAAELTLRLGRPWEARAWSHYGLSADPNHARLRQLAGRIPSWSDQSVARAQLTPPLLDAQWVASLPLPHWQATQPKAQSSSDDSGHPQYLPKFSEVPSAFDFTYFAARTAFEDGRRMFEMTGGGVGILDYDRDGWPDVFLAQGCAWPPESEPLEHADCLLRNQLTQPGNTPKFAEVTRQARIVEHAFGQGVAVGDVDSDGFDDIYVCNFGENQLWLNQGDGTFADGSPRIAAHSSSWTVSAAIADLNGDAVAEIYDANYVSGEDVTTRRCLIGGQPRACSPRNFVPAPGRLLAIDDSGLFRDVSRQVFAASIEDGNALGLAVVRLSSDRLPSIFVANDQVANLLLAAQPDAHSPLGIRFEDQALIRGLAYDAEGRAQACMGIATGDLNHDGRLDLFVTNYHDEANTLYLQQAEGAFRDATLASGLVAPSLEPLGFGTQCFDAQLDGQPDIVVLNGHIDDMTHVGVPFRMRPQFFAGDSAARLVEQAPAEIGPFFASLRVGRALALLDADRDGRQDLIAGDLEQPTCLLRNESPSGNYVVISLVGIQSHRDAIGAQVTVTADGQVGMNQLVAGGGYMSSNQRQLHFGLGAATQVERIEIMWPSGIRQQMTHIPCNTQWMAIEGQSVWPMP